MQREGEALAEQRFRLSRSFALPKGDSGYALLAVQMPGFERFGLYLITLPASKSLQRKILW